MPVIEVNHVTKEYRLGTLTNLKDSFSNQFKKLRGLPVDERKPFKALDDVDFKVEAGEVVGIIGHNGAGKSTLLKILSGIVTPTSGSIQVRGKVAPLIEVGAGLIGDLTGRENIYLNASILGMKRAEIDKKLDEIIAFAELEEFIDTPIKRYSSGMSVRLGFSIATSVDADILIVDEVLAVGDLAFQRKCIDRMSHIINDSGRTVLFVSHNIRHVEQICTRALLLTSGQILIDDKPNKTCSEYYELTDKAVLNKIGAKALHKDEQELGQVEIKLIDDLGRETDQISYGEKAQFIISIENIKNIKELSIGIGIQTADRINIVTQSSGKFLRSALLPPGKNSITLLVNEFPILPGSYTVRVGITVDEIPRTIFYGEELLNFKVIGHNRVFDQSIKDEGFILLNGKWTYTNKNNSKDQGSYT